MIQVAKGAMVLAVLLLNVGWVWAQVVRPEPFSEAEKAIQADRKVAIEFDSLKRVYAKRWTIGLVYGLRFLDAANQLPLPDTVTFADFNDQRSIFGLEVGHFIKDRWQLTAGFDMLFLPRQQEIRSISFAGPNGPEVEGSGAGGVMLNIGLGARYFLITNRFGRPYLGMKIGSIRAIAKGGDGGFTPGRGQFREVRERAENYAYVNPTAGFAHRLTPGFAFNFNLGYMYSTQSKPIARMRSPGGVTTTLTLEIILGARKE